VTEELRKLHNEELHNLYSPGQEKEILEVVAEKKSHAPDWNRSHIFIG
jgi:hypothetical protein